jgi:protein-disulfide isomerase
MISMNMSMQVMSVRIFSGVRSDVNGTPTFFLNGIRYDNSWNYETLLVTLVHVIKENQLADM